MRKLLAWLFVGMGALLFLGAITVQIIKVIEMGIGFHVLGSVLVTAGAAWGLKEIISEDSPR